MGCPWRDDQRHYADVKTLRRKFTRPVTLNEWSLIPVFAPEYPCWIKLDDLPIMGVTRIGAGMVSRQIIQSSIGPINPDDIYKEKTK